MKIPETLLVRGYFDVTLSSTQSSKIFEKVFYRLFDQNTKEPIDQPVFIHYIGTSNIEELKSFLPWPHGNIKDKSNANSFHKEPCLLQLIS